VDLTEQVEKEHAQPASKKPRIPMRTAKNKAQASKDEGFCFA